MTRPKPIVRTLVLTEQERAALEASLTVPWEISEEQERELRLQQLREEFEATLARGHYNYEGWPVDTVAICDKLFLQAELDAARRYIIARDFNEFDPGKADMLWKLQNGGAL